MENGEPKFKRNDRVAKRKGDYTFEGNIRGAFLKSSGALRYVVEDDRGLLFIFSEQQLEQA